MISITRVIDTYARQEQESISYSYELLGKSRQVYYQRIKLVKQVRYQLSRLGTRKLYYVLQTELQAMKIGRNKLFDILRSNHLLIVPKQSYHITSNSHHHFRKHKTWWRK